MYSVGNIVNSYIISFGIKTTYHSDHSEMYRNIESLFCVTGIYIIL